MIVFEILRKINRYIKQSKKSKAGIYLSPVRRIERVYPLLNERVCAMTFDDGPSALPPNPPRSNATLASASSQMDNMSNGVGSLGLTETLMTILEKYNAVGTFDCIGGTQENYPDKRGKLHTAKWGGTAHDHYPDFERDQFAGILNQPELGKSVLQRGHEMANHGGRHVIFGPMRLIYDSRTSLSSLESVLEDLTLFHNFAHEQFNHTATFSRPPHYIDGIKGGLNAYDVYAMMGYQYMAASFDGGGWKPSKGQYNEDVEAMVSPLRKSLDADANTLNGQIIFQKDGCNMSLQTPIADALEPQLQILKEKGYKVIGVGELVKRSPFEDYGEGHAHFEDARTLINAGFIVAYKNNSFQPQRILTFGELVAMTTPKDLFVALTALKTKQLRVDFDYAKWHVDKIEAAFVKVRTTHPYYWMFKYAKKQGYLGQYMDQWDIDDSMDAHRCIQYLDHVLKAHQVELNTDQQQERARLCSELMKMATPSLKRVEILPLLKATLESAKLL
ncbi:polysaccharide deacetylase family protein [Fusibacter ferrireducens]|uniref:Polysaccharide deacetylase family protein n=1 Tax=Fusibacter ferrireducens TaxID=2785058 RepID=A0ABR9ZY53_9FIRM|nr:polysaccharide deacetylase family protein [Fusibacter ferrireducens]MBF4695390.1 polysaccharide deacetylase family protein [Fusibacter ferrireducens]